MCEALGWILLAMPFVMILDKVFCPPPPPPKDFGPQPGDSDYFNHL